MENSSLTSLVKMSGMLPDARRSFRNTCGSGFRVQVSGFRVQGAGFRVRMQGSGCRVQGSGLGCGRYVGHGKVETALGMCM